MWERCGMPRVNIGLRAWSRYSSSLWNAMQRRPARMSFSRCSSSTTSSDAVEEPANTLIAHTLGSLSRCASSADIGLGAGDVERRCRHSQEDTCTGQSWQIGNDETRPLVRDQPGA
jgi:hypothetical protein